MLKTPLSPSRVEQTVAFLRLFGLAAGGALLLLTDFPDQTSRVIAVVTIAALIPVTALMWMWSRRPGRRTALMVHVGFGADLLLITGFCLGFAHLQPNVSWAVVFTLLADAAMRYGAVGSAVGLALGSMLLVGEIQIHAAMTGRDTDVVAYLFVIATLVGIAGVLAIFSHVLERQHREAQEHALALADAQRLRERLIAVSTHELRGSLAAVYLGADTVRTHIEEMSPQQVRNTLDVVVRQSEYLQRLVSELLSVARARSEDVTITPTSADVADTIDRALAAASRHHDGHIVELSAPHLVLEVDHGRLQQVVRNLVENAYKYTPAGGRVSIAARSDHGVLEIQVADSGPGIPAVDHERVFEPFGRRADGAAGTEGVGLGLYLVKQIVDAMDGSIDLLSSGRGTEFVVRVPTTLLQGTDTAGTDPRADPST